jgi:hypothetical protein
MTVTIEKWEALGDVVYKFSDNPYFIVINKENEAKIESRIEAYFSGKSNELILSDKASFFTEDQAIKYGYTK